MDTLKRFLEALEAEEKEFTRALADDKLGLVLRGAISELDWYQYNISRVEEPTAEQQEQFYILQLGVARLTKLALEARTSFEVPTVTFRREPARSVAFLQIVAGLGMIEHGRRVAQTVATGLCRITVRGPSDYLFSLPHSVIDEDHYEISVAEHYRKESRKRIAALVNSAIGTTIADKVNKLLSQLVHTFEKHYIGYGAHPLLDAYFFGLATSTLQLADGYDTFHYEARFGDVTFQKYLLALTFCIAITLRHERFAEALVAKEPHIQHWNILTISCDTGTFLEGLRHALNEFGSSYVGYEETTAEQARQIFEVLSISRRNTTLLSRPASPLPLMIQSSEEGFIRCNAGAYDAPMQFLLNSLRHHFPRNYNQRQQSRERSMQVALKRVLDDAFTGLDHLGNIRVRIDGCTLTDIDHVVTERSTGAVFLCQLKHQEIYGADIALRHERANRLREESERWLKALEKWTSTVGTRGVRTALRVSKDFPPIIVHRIVVSRHHVYPLNDLASQDDVACATWPQFCNAINLLTQTKELKERSLLDLVMILRTRPPGGPMDHLPEPRSEWIIRTLRFTTEQDPIPQRE